MRRLAPAAALLLAAAPATAQDRPQIFPTRDVAVTYRFIGERLPQGAPQGMTMAWQASTQTLRSDIPGMGWMVADQKAGRAFMVMEGMRVIMDVPLGQVMGQYGPSPNATFRREGRDTVAGLACTVWSYQDGPNQGRSCVTADGVMLRAQGTHQGQSGGMEATQVSYGTQDPARFQRPAGYQAMQIPQGMAPGMAPGMPRPPTR
jgi:hypothetical protein